jgi:hypothetical protein
LDESRLRGVDSPHMTPLLHSPAPWYAAGPLIGLPIVLFLWLTNKPFGALGGYFEADEWLARERRDVGWRALFMVGVVGV